MRETQYPRRRDDTRSPREQPRVQASVEIIRRLAPALTVAVHPGATLGKTKLGGNHERELAQKVQERSEKPDRGHIDDSL
jgi:hypothetical protein